MSDYRGNAIAMISAERERQVSAERYGPYHDDQHTGGTLAKAAAVYALPERYRGAINYPSGWRFKPSPHNRIRELVKAGALIVAEIERLQRKARGAS